MKPCKVNFTVKEWLAFKSYKHPNDVTIKYVPEGYNYGDTSFQFPTYPLYDAVTEINDPYFIEELIKEGADPNFHNGHPALISLIANNRFYNVCPIVEIFIKYKVDINAITKINGNNALHEAAYRWKSSHSEQLVALLINNNADITLRNDENLTPYEVVLTSKLWYPQSRSLEYPTKILNMLDVTARNVRLYQSQNKE